MEQLKCLRLKRPRSIKQALITLPKGLDEIYERILAKIPPGNIQEALNALRWISFAIRPLFVEEIIEACAVHPESDPEFDATERYTPSDIFDVAPRLLTVDLPIAIGDHSIIHGKHTAKFAHFIVQKSLLGTSILSSTASGYSLEPSYSHDSIAGSCLAYLLCCIP